MMAIEVYEAIQGVGIKVRGRFVDTFAAKLYCLDLHKQGKQVAVADPVDGLRWPDANPGYFKDVV